MDSDEEKLKLQAKIVQTPTYKKYSIILTTKKVTKVTIHILLPL